MSQVSEKLASREKYWEECDAEQKIERLRDAVAGQCRLLTQQVRFLAKLAVHQHAPDGRLLALIANDLEERGPSLFAHDNGIPHNLRREHERR